MKEIVIAIIAALPVGYASWVSYRKDLKIQVIQTQLNNEREKKEELLQSFNNIGAINDFKFMQALFEASHCILKKTKVDRLLFFFASNGKTKPKYTNIVYGWVKDGEDGVPAIVQLNLYVNIELDAHYQKHLNKVEAEDYVVLDLLMMPSGILREYYESEGVSHSVHNFIDRIHRDQDNDLILYASASTFDNYAFSAKDVTEINLNIHKMQVASKLYLHG